MKQFRTFLAILFVSLLSSPSWSEGISADDLVERDGLFYKKFTDVPFTGEVDEGLKQGSFKNGRREGHWVWYHANGQLMSKGEYKSGRQEGLWVTYNKNGQLFIEANFKEGEQEGPWLWYSYDGTVEKKLTGTFKNGKKISE